MTDFLGESTTWLAGVHKSHASTQVEYRRSASESFFVYATFARTETEELATDSITIDSFIRDFLILYADLGQDPEPGDLIIVKGRKFELLEVGGEGCWRWSDDHQIRARIHTRDIGSDDG